MFIVLLLFKVFSVGGGATIREGALIRRNTVDFTPRVKSGLLIIIPFNNLYTFFIQNHSIYTEQNWKRPT